MPAQAPELPGDYNGDRSVNAADYSVWRNTLGTNVGRYSGADGDGNGRVEMLDYLVWKEHYGESLNQVAALPQALPATIVAATTAPAPVENTPSEAGSTPPAANSRQQTAERVAIPPEPPWQTGRSPKYVAPANETRYAATDRGRWLLAAAVALLAPSGPPGAADDGHVGECEPESWQREVDAAARSSAFESFGSVRRKLR